MLDDLFVSQASFDWDQFLVKDADYAAGDVKDSASAVLTLRDSSPADDSSPKSTESDQSQQLDTSGLGLLDFDFELPATGGIAHDPKDIIASLSESTQVVPDAAMSADPTMLSTFGSLDFGSLAALGNDSVSQLQLGNILNQLSAPADPAPATVSSGLTAAYAALGWPTAKEEKAAVSMKRKASDMSNDGAAKRTRATGTPVAKRPYRRQSKNGLSLSQLAAAAASGSPLVVEDCLTPGSPEEVEDDIKPVRLTATGKPSTARPKAVVPEKYMKNGEAQAITGMTTEQIMAFPNWSALMECVDEEHRAGADIFGKMISENRDKAKWAAKKSRDERKAKVESLEGEIDELKGKINEMRGVLLGLVGRGVISLSEVENYI